MAITSETSPATLPIQPEPAHVDVFHLWFGQNCATTIAREWRDSRDADRCRLCPRSRCTARGTDHCIVMVNRYIPAESAALFVVADPSAWSDGRMNVAHADANR